MKTKKNKTEKDFDTVKTFREIKDKISQEIKGMNFEQLKEYFEKTKLKTQGS
jgi:hypothetical protein